MKISLFLTLLTFYFSSYAQNNENETKWTSSYAIKDSTEYKIRILENGDEYAYDALCYIYEYDFKKLLPFSLILSEKYNNESVDVYIYTGIFEFVKTNKKINIDKREALVKLALFYMKRALMNDNFSARVDLIDLYKKGEYVKKNEDAVLYLENGGTEIDNFLKQQNKNTTESTD